MKNINNILKTIVLITLTVEVIYFLVYVISINSNNLSTGSVGNSEVNSLLLFFGFVLLAITVYFYIFKQKKMSILTASVLLVFSLLHIFWSFKLLDHLNK